MKRKPSHLPSTSCVLFPLAVKQKYYFKPLKLICHSPQRCSRVHYFPVFEIHAALLISTIIKKKNPSSWIIGSYKRVSCHSCLKFGKQSKMKWKRAHSGSGPLFESWRRWGFSWALSLRLSVCRPGQIAHLSKNALSLLVCVIRTGGLIWETPTDVKLTFAQLCFPCFYLLYDWNRHLFQ